MGDIVSLTVPAETGSLPTVNQFLRQNLEAVGCPETTMFQSRLAVEEIFINITSYAYAPGTGEAEIRCTLLDDPPRARIRIMDSGKPFDPLARADADTSEDALLAREGGLGILLVKDSMDDVQYSYENGKNSLSILKQW